MRHYVVIDKTTGRHLLDQKFCSAPDRFGYEYTNSREDKTKPWLPATFTDQGAAEAQAQLLTSATESAHGVQFFDTDYVQPELWWRPYVFKIEVAELDDMELLEAAKHRVDIDPVLKPHHSDIIGYGWENKREHLEWVVNATAEDLLDLVKKINK
jgi:hypothetical protein